MSAARARRRLMAWERYRRRALLLGALPYGLMSRPHRDLMHAINDRIRGYGYAWILHDPHRRSR